MTMVPRIIAVLLCISAAAAGALAQPAGVTDLAAASSVESQVTLQWTAPAPHDGTAAPDRYIVKYATSEIQSTDLSAGWVSTYAQNWAGLAAAGSSESRQLTGLMPGTTLYFAVVAVDTNAVAGPWLCSSETGGLNNPDADTPVFDTAPAAVAGFAAAASTGCAHLSWQANTELDCASYRLERSSYSAAAGFALCAGILAAGTTHQDNGLINGVTYFYRIRAEDAAGNAGAFSAVQSTMPWIFLTPATPAAAWTHADSSTTITWSWQPGTGMTGYRVLSATSGAAVSGDLSAATTFWLQTTLTPNTSAAVIIEACNGLVTAASPVTNTVYTLANTPADPTASASGTSVIDIAWNSNGNAANTRYTVQYSTNNFLSAQVIMNLARSTTHQHTGLVEGCTYTYRLWATNDAAVESTKVSTAAVTGRLAPAPPMLISVVPGAADGDMVVTWAASGDDGTSGMCTAYTIKWSSSVMTDSAFSTLQVSSVVAATVPYGQAEPARTLRNLFPGTTYWVAVRAADEAGNFSANSNTITVISPDLVPQAPSGVLVSALNSSTIDITWSLPGYSGYDDRSLYKVYRATFTFSGYQQNVSTFNVTHPGGFYRDSGLYAETTYYYRISTCDLGDQGNGLYSEVNESGLSAAQSAYTPDTTAPGAITQITALTGATEGMIALQWTAPGDDGPINPITAGLFRIDYSTDAGTNFVLSNYRVQYPTAAVVGGQHAAGVTGLSAGTTYYFRIWTADEAGNWSALSAAATAWAQVDVTPPAAAGSFSVTGAWHHVRLNWTAPGDDDATGTLTGVFEVRLSSTAAIDTEPAWDQAGSGYPYRILVATTAAAGSAHSLAITGLCTGTTYYCAIKSADERGNYSVLAASGAYPVNNTPLGFGFIGPADMTISTNGQPELSWTAAPDPDEPYGDQVTYDVVYATESAFHNPVSISTPAISCGCDLRPYEDKTIYWRVYARDTDGATVAIVPGQYRIRINAVNTAPATFSLAAPAVSSITATATPQLSWAAALDADPGDTIRYTVTWSRYADFHVAATSAGINATAFTVPTLTENATYWWAVSADDGKESTACAAPFYFRVDAQQENPGGFALTAPSDGQVVDSTTVHFAWQASTDPDPADTLTYSVSWSATADFVSSTTVTGLAVTSHTCTGLAENGIYYWRAVATDNSGLSTTASQTYHFYVDTVKELPGSFDLQNPGNGCIISTTTTPLFSWTRSMDADPADDVRYIIDLSPNQNFTGLGTMAIDRGADRYYLPLIGLTDQTTYYWRVRASGYQGNPLPQQVDDGFTFSSTTGTFVIAMTNNAPESFALQSPADGATLSSKRVRFSWSAAADQDVNASVVYAVWISTAADFSVTFESATAVSGLVYDAAAAFPENRTYYWKVRAVDNQELFTDCASTFTFHLPVLNTLEPPAGLAGTLSADKNTFTISWSPVTRNTDTSAADDLAVYRVYRGLSAQRLAVYASVAAPAAFWSDPAVDGGNYYYRVTAVDASGIESAPEDSPVINSLGAGLQTLLTADQSVAVEIPPAVAASLRAANNAYQQTLRLQLTHDAAAENDGVLLSYRLQVIAENGSALEHMVFSEPVTLRFYYATAASAARRAGTAAAESRHVFWHNGIEYIRVGGTDDPAEQCVVLCAAKTGEYQLRAVVRPAVFALAGTNPRKVFTPGIAPYEKISFYVDNPENDKVTGAVFNLRGELVCNLAAVGDATAANVILEWDGRESDGVTAPKGVYIYQIKGSGKVVNGTVLVAR